jgi:hypothetical protein
MKIISSVLLIVTLSTPRIHAEIDEKDYHKQTHWQQSTGGLRKLRSRIVGGNDADIGEYPFFVEWAGCAASLVHKGELNFFFREQLTPLLLSSMLTLPFLVRFSRHRHISCSLCWYQYRHCLRRVVQ